MYCISRSGQMYNFICGFATHEIYILTSLGEINKLQVNSKNVNILYIILGWEIFNCQLSFIRYEREMA